MDAVAADTSFDAATLFAQELPDACMVLSLDGRVQHWSRQQQKEGCEEQGRDSAIHRYDPSIRHVA